MQKRFFSLRLIASAIGLLSWCMLILSFLEVLFLAALNAGITETSDDELLSFIQALNVGLGLNTIFLLVTGLISFVLLNSVSERIRLFIQIEENTRVINQNLSKITKLLESKFQIEAEDVDEKISIIDKIIYWGQIIPIVISILFFLSIIKQLPRGINQHNAGAQEIIKSNDSLKIIWEGQNNFNSVFTKTSTTDWIENCNSGIFYYTEIPIEKGIDSLKYQTKGYLLKDKIREGVKIFLNTDKAYYIDNSLSEWLFLGYGHFKNIKSDSTDDDKLVIPDYSKY